ncbi:MAG TPA: hypothetical protein VGN34_31265 [Ktedonobacteraceae bacterium]|jgi:hypothetical protein
MQKFVGVRWTAAELRPGTPAISLAPQAIAATKRCFLMLRGRDEGHPGVVPLRLHHAPTNFSYSVFIV